jgi:transposase
MRGGLVDDAGQCAKLLGAGGYSRVARNMPFGSPGGIYGRDHRKPGPPASRSCRCRILHSRHLASRLGSISKQGDRYLRSLFTAGALAGPRPSPKGKVPRTTDAVNSEVRPVSAARGEADLNPR